MYHLPVCGSHDENSSPAFHSIHFSQQLVDHSGAGVVGAATVLAPTSSGTEGVQFVKEDHTGGGVASTLENLPHCPLALTDILQFKQL